MRFAVVGDPIEHSLSPRIHTAAYDALGLRHSYGRIRVPSGAFPSVVEQLREGALAGVNVTMPHKDAAFGAVDERTRPALRSQAVNTITVADGALIAHNTDIDGVMFAIDLLGLPPEAPVSILGAGGAARAALVAMEGRPITLVARDEERARDALASTGVDAKRAPWGSAVPPGIVINATPIGMQPDGPELPPRALEGAIGMLDMAYGHGRTPAIHTMERRGLPVSDGISMLVGQGASAFELFTGTPAPVDVMMHEARRSAS